MNTLIRVMIVMVSSIILVLGSVMGPIPVLAAGNAAVTTGWEVKEIDLESGRKVFARVPTCAPVTEQACSDFLAEPRTLLVYMHGAGFAEDAATATGSLNYLAPLKPNTIMLYGVSQGGTKKWDSGICCTFNSVDEVGYLVQAVDHVDARYGVNRSRVGIFGDSNGGMMSHKAACERPDVFRAAASHAGTYTGPCNKQGVQLAQWHGSADTVVPINGGNTSHDGRQLTFPPASDIGSRMATGTIFTLIVIPGHDHSLSGWVYGQQIIWLTYQLGG